MNIDNEGNYQFRQRITEQLKQYWLEIKSDSIFPDEAKVNINNLENHWQSCFLVKHENNNFSYIYLGEELMSAYGDNYLQKENCEKIVFPSTNPLLERFKQVLINKELLEYEDEFVNSQELLIRYRAIILPLGQSNRTENVVFLLGGMRWKAYL